MKSAARLLRPRKFFRKKKRVRKKKHVQTRFFFRLNYEIFVVKKVEILIRKSIFGSKSDLKKFLIRKNCVKNSSDAKLHFFKNLFYLFCFSVIF